MNPRPAYLAIGHACQDVVPGGYEVGGTVNFALRVAQVLGYETRLLTSTAPDYPFAAALPHTLIHNIPAPATTTFENVMTPRGRVQTLHARAHTLTPAHLPPTWPTPAIIHLAPIANEISPDLIATLTPSAPFLCLTPQGWLRTWDEAGHVSACAWDAAADVLPLTTAVVASREDWPDTATFETFRRHAPLLIVTEGANGCQVYHNGAAHHVPAPVVTEVESTGAGDVFAAAFFIRLHQTGDVLAAAQFATQLAAHSVTQPTPAAKIVAMQTFLHNMR
jgi:sugar/nucleoside kinase (ribokinase family)